MSYVLKIGLVAGLVAAASGPSAGGKSNAANTGVRITRLEDRLRVELNGELFTEYFFKEVPRPYCYPLIGPGGAAMTRNYPMKSPPGEEHDHPHHRSLWFAHGLINGQDFWSEAKDSGKTVHESFTKISLGKKWGLFSRKSGVIRERNKWVGTDGKTVCTDDRGMKFYVPGRSNERVIDVEVTLHASNGEVRFGDTKEGSMAVRLAETMRLKGKVVEGHGHIINSEGVKDDATWGKRAEWCDYYGPVDGKTVGMAIFDHPQNPRHPTWWHVRDYGLFAANPFGQHDFEKKSDKSAGDLVLAAGKSLTFRYRLYLHEGDEKQANVAEKYQEYVKGTAAR